MKMRLLAFSMVCLLAAGSLSAARLKDLVDIEGVRDNQLIGYGLVVGLAGTGDKQQTFLPTKVSPTCWNEWASSCPPRPFR
jgi:flagellar P-ring protein precursor FlgI